MALLHLLCRTGTRQNLQSGFASIIDRRFGGVSREEQTEGALNEDDLVLLCGGRDIAKGREGEDEEKAQQSRCSSHLLPLNASRADASIGGSGAVYIPYNQRCGQALEAMDRGAETRTWAAASLNVCGRL